MAEIPVLEQSLRMPEYAPLARQIGSFVPADPHEAETRLQMLRYLADQPLLLERENTLAHFTASALIVDPFRRRTLLIYHNLYDSWGWTGGHADGCADLLDVALREAQEETGARGIRPLTRRPIALDILPVWGHEKRGKQVTAHLHLNLSYLLEADPDAAVRPKTDENSAVGWFSLEQLMQVTTEREMRPVYRKLIAAARQIMGDGAAHTPHKKGNTM